MLQEKGGENMKNSETKDFVAYEYLSTNVTSDKEALYVDCYENFGWKLTSSNSNYGLVDKEDYYINNSNLNDNKLVNLKFKRDRKIPNKAKIISLQKKCENGLKELARLEKEPKSKGSFYAVISAIIGTIFLAISVFAITATNPIYVLSVITGIIGLVCWFISYPIYNQIKIKQEEINTSLIEEQYNVIYDSCEQAQKLLN